MGGRGTFASGNSVAYNYETVGKIEGVKVLKGTSDKHSLPEEAHSSDAYILPLTHICDPTRLSQDTYPVLV